MKFQYRVQIEEQKVEEIKLVEIKGVEEWEEIINNVTK